MWNKIEPFGIQTGTRSTRDYWHNLYHSVKQETHQKYKI